jgi:hypothetical protein
MQLQICEHCGQQFLSQSIVAKFWDCVFPIDLIVAAVMAWGCCRIGGGAWFGALIFVSYVIGRIKEMVEKNKKKKGRLLKVGRDCPSCGDRSADVDSPLGKQIAERWLSPEMDSLPGFDGPATQHPVTQLELDMAVCEGQQSLTSADRN